MDSFYKNFCLFDWVLKANSKSSYEVPVLTKAVVSTSNRKLKSSPETSPFLFYGARAFSSQIPFFTRIKHQASAFKTRKGDFCGYKLTLGSSKLFDFVFLFFVLLAPEFSQIGLVPGFGISSSGAFSISAPTATFLPFFLNSETVRTAVNFGFDVNFSFNQKLTNQQTAVVLSMLLRFIEIDVEES